MIKLLRILGIFILLNSSTYALSIDKLVKDARNQIGITLYYDPTYTQLSYPFGDVPLIKGVCSDVVVRALRKQNIDLQQLIHDDMKTSFSKYPKRWRMKSTDRNIDHRRVLNIAKYLERQGYSVSQKNETYLAGDIVVWDLGNGLTHIGILSDIMGVTELPLVIHNIGNGVQEEDVLESYKIIGHYRMP